MRNGPMWGMEGMEICRKSIAAAPHPLLSPFNICIGGGGVRFLLLLLRSYNWHRRSSVDRTDRQTRLESREGGEMDVSHIAWVGRLIRALERRIY